jgi:hypothetical protein
VAVPVAVTYLAWLVRRGVRGEATTWVRGVLPLVLVLAVGAAAMAANNRAVTGSFLRPPYAEYNDQYDRIPQFSFLSLKPPIPSLPARHRRFELDESFGVPNYQASQRLSPRVRYLAFMLNDFSSLVLGPILVLPVLLVPWMVATRWLAWALGVLGLMISAQLVIVYQQMHYFAPIVPLVFLFVAEGLRRLRTLRGRGAMTIRVPARYLIFLSLACACWGFLHQWSRARIHAQSQASKFPDNRRMIARQLAAIPGQHVVLVRYAPDYNIYWEWVEWHPLRK